MNKKRRLIMNKFVMLFSLIVLVSGIFFSCSSIKLKKNADKSLSNKEKTVALLNSLESGDTQPVGYINPEKYIQHNLMVGDGLEGFGQLMKTVPAGSIKVDIVRAFSDGDYVFTHTDYDFFGPKSGFDIFRFEDGKIVEHWDNLAVKEDRLNPGGHTQFDGPVKARDLSLSEENKRLVKNFVETILIKGEFNKLSAFFNGDNYIQHNTAIGDGVSGLGKAIKAMAERGIKMTYTKNHLILGEGNFVLAVSEGEFAEKPTSFYDLFRVQNGKIAEHWDVIETILPPDKRKNRNGKFNFKK